MSKRAGAVDGNVNTKYLFLVVCLLAWFFFTLLLVASSAAVRHHSAVQQFERQTGFPHGRPGFVVDHRIPLCAGGPDEPVNMQWEALAESYVKDNFERALCKELVRQGYVLVKK